MIPFCRFAPLLLLLGVAVASADERAGTPDDWPAPMPDPGPFWMVQADRLETTVGEARDAYTWDIQGWYGYDKQRLRWKTEGEGEWGDRADNIELQLLYSHLFAPYWEWQLGLRRDAQPGDGRSFLVAGVQGVAPYLIAVDATLFISGDGDVSARVEAEYDLQITQKTLLQPRVEVNSFFSAVPELGIKNGTVDSEFGIRLRHEIRREFAPYVGLAWEHKQGRSATALVAGLHFWF